MRQPVPVYLHDTLIAWETHAVGMKLVSPLMEQAGSAAAKLATTLALEQGGLFRIVAGPGNNGGDGFVVARLLHQLGVPCEVLTLSDAPPAPADARRAWQSAKEAGVRIIPFHAALSDSALIVDGIYGAGLSRPAEGIARTAIEAINAARTRGVPVLALDVPSGVIADSGRVLQPAVRASATITFLGAKPGLYTGQGPDYCGRIVVAPLAPEIDLATPGFLNGPATFGALLRPRQKDSNKGTFGTIAVIGGASGSVGAALLSSRAALYTGAGKVLVQTLSEPPVTLDLVHPELMMQASINLEHASVVVIGPGLGQSDIAKAALERAIACPLPAVIDADALNLLSLNETLKARLISRTAGTVITPHPLEAARLLGEPVEKVQADRIGSALELARRHNCVVILKGTGSIVAEPGGRWGINCTGNPGLASGGTGDVLSGVCGALLGHKQDAFQTALAACFIHGDAADRLVREGTGPIGITASELMPAIRASFNQLVAQGA
jgi:ADP-dependent NAD(P)H-hydrate dehydratase / NAD(P)H-hydrate epimerase